MLKLIQILVLSAMWTFANAQTSRPTLYCQLVGIPDSANWTRMIQISRGGDTMCIWDTEKKQFTKLGYNCRLDDIDRTLFTEFEKRCPEYNEVYIESPGDTSFSTIVNGRTNGHFHHAGYLKYEDGEIADGYHVGWWEEGWSMGKNWGPPYNTEFRYYSKHFFQDGLSLGRTIVPCSILLILLLIGLFIMKRLKKYPLYFYLMCAAWIVSLFVMVAKFLSVNGSFKSSPTQREEDTLSAYTGYFLIISAILFVLSTINLFYRKDSQKVFALSIVIMSITMLIILLFCILELR